mmetsp:Transcript_103001/g.331937  ORF Transcript_103001/g.331937 Transcript_103001/m.331937 type:complete len:192 (-) Transcript_103001:462-1037(-)
MAASRTPWTSVVPRPSTTRRWAAPRRRAPTRKSSRGGWTRLWARSAARGRQSPIGVFLLSCDCAHGLHPNYADKHQPQHQPLLGKGVVIKTNANQRYATTPILAQMVREVGKKDQVPIQEFVVRNDCPCGSTIGPLLSSQLGLRTVDVGAPQWAMHSCRETAHSADVESLQKLCLGLFKNFRAVDNSTRRL